MIKWIHQYFNHMGILSVKLSGNSFLYSKTHALLNVLKILTFITIKLIISKTSRPISSTIFSKLMMSPFFKIFLTVVTNQRHYQTIVLFIHLQLIASKNLKLVNELITFHDEFKSIFSPVKRMLEKHEEKLYEKFAAITIAVLLFVSMNFIVTMQLSLSGFLFYMFFAFPVFVNTSLVFYVYICIQTIVCFQNALTLYLSVLKKEPSCSLKTKVFDDILLMHSKLYSIKRKFQSSLSTTISMVMLFIISEFVTTVMTLVRTFDYT